MLQNVIEHWWVYVFIWGIFFLSFFINRSRLRNGFYLGIAILYTLFDLVVNSQTDSSTSLIMFTTVIVIILASVPFVLIANGITMLKKEGRSIANLLSLFFGIFIFLGEISFIIFILNGIDIINVDPLVGFFGCSVFYICLVFVNFMVYTIFIMHVPHVHDFDYLIVHGCGLLNGNRISKILSSRLDKAIQVYKSDKTPPIIITSGGQGDDEDLPESTAMAKYLIEHDIPKENILEENESCDTLANIFNSKRIIDNRNGRKRVALISSNYHVYRCLVYAHKAKLKCTGIGSKTALYFWPSALIREFVAVYTDPLYLLFLLIGWLPCFLCFYK